MQLGETTVLFTFSYRHVCYAVTQAENGILDCRKISWNIWSGFFASREEPSDEVLEIFRRFIDLRYEQPEKYKFRGEHYVISRVNGTEGERLKIAFAPTLTIKGSGYWCPLLIRLSFFLILSVLMCLMFSSIVTSWLTYLFPEVRMSSEMSEIVIYAAETVGTCLIFFAVGKHRSVLSMCCYLYVPLGTLVLLGLMKRWFFIALVAPILLALLYTRLRRLYPSVRSRKKSKMFLFSNALCSLSFAAIITVSFLHLTPYSGYRSHESISANEELSENYQQACAKLCNFDRKETSLQEKLDILQAICDYECIVVFGCTEAPLVQMGQTDRETVLGYYVDSSRTITIRSEHLKDDDAESVLCTLLHEIRHYMQYRTIELYASLEPYIEDEYVNMSPFRDAVSFLNNFKSYHSGTDDYELYYHQAVEEDSRKWAEDQIEKYFPYIYPYLSAK